MPPPGKWWKVPPGALTPLRPPPVATDSYRPIVRFFLILCGAEVSNELVPKCPDTSATDFGLNLVPKCLSGLVPKCPDTSAPDFP